VRRGRPTPPVLLSPEERETLEAWQRRPSTGQALALRTRIVLASAEGEWSSQDLVDTPPAWFTCDLPPVAPPAIARVPRLG
jgi:hypothetical protein